MTNYCLITGAASGIGLEFAKIYLKNEFNLVLVDLNIERLEQIKKEFQKESNQEIILMQKDLLQ